MMWNWSADFPSTTKVCNQECSGNLLGKEARRALHNGDGDDGCPCDPCVR